MSGKVNKARRKQERLRQRRQQGPVLIGQPRSGEVCPLYRDPPAGEFYDSWVDCGTVRRTIAWSGAVVRDRRAADPDVPGLARRMPYLASVYGRMVPVAAAWQLDRYIDAESLPVQWAPGGPVTMVSASQLAPVPDGASAAETRVAIHDLHARRYLRVADDGTVIPQVPDKPDLAGAGSYDPARYHLARAPRPESRARMLRMSGARARYGPGYLVTGIIWSQQEFLALPWVRDYLPASGPPAVSRTRVLRSATVMERKSRRTWPSSTWPPTTPR